MFSNGQHLFAVFFVIAFSAVLIFTYKKDFKGHQVHYKGSFKILLSFIAAIAILFMIKYFNKLWLLINSF
ncbi:MAG: hypothetical protein MUQ91_04680 [Flavobacteriaceae bacterium]|nr:hypothetical protein [Flavobacteriaceae bacterium]MDO7581703.1 hypothetical protein [Flavobacteriaceae bacterium]MDO7591459.1 hypothetical protein [Flavobacteriaceae bacterium]MDO7598952.1 hypothetical protein [Flavobacteriaceae bacterium]MDO7603215.1 hypothetical protein [Flavobacteriaceae bacterium]